MKITCKLPTKVYLDFYGFDDQAEMMQYAKENPDIRPCPQDRGWVEKMKCLVCPRLLRADWEDQWEAWTYGAMTSKGVFLQEKAGWK